jgi:hypothetical protein
MYRYIFPRDTTLYIDITDPNQHIKPVPRLSGHHNMMNRHQDDLVWDIEDNFEFQVKGMQNMEITSDQVKDNIDKVNYILFYFSPKVFK